MFMYRYYHMEKPYFQILRFFYQLRSVIKRINLYQLHYNICVRFGWREGGSTGKSRVNPSLLMVNHQTLSIYSPLFILKSYIYLNVPIYGYSPIKIINFYITYTHSQTVSRISCYDISFFFSNENKLFKNDSNLY